MSHPQDPPGAAAPLGAARPGRDLQPVEEGLGDGSPEVVLCLQARGLFVISTEDVVVFTLCHGRGV